MDPTFIKCNVEIKDNCIVCVCYNIVCVCVTVLKYSVCVCSGMKVVFIYCRYYSDAQIDPISKKYLFLIIFGSQSVKSFEIKMPIEHFYSLHNLINDKDLIG